MHQTLGFCDPHRSDYACRLRKSLYGLKQASHAWYQRFNDFVSTIGFQHSTSYHSLFIYRCGSDMAYILLYVDITSSHDLRKSIMALLAFKFTMKDLGPLSYFLGIVVTKHDGGLFLSQSTYASDITARVGMASCKPSGTPVDTKQKLVPPPKLHMTTPLYIEVLQELYCILKGRKTQEGGVELC